MLNSFSNKELFIFNKIASAAQELGVKAYLIGGFVRDKIIERNTKDADIVCIGDGIALAHKVAERFNPQPHVAYFKNFGTAQIRLNVSNKTKNGEVKEEFFQKN